MMTLTPGTRLGPYEIVAPGRAGGMGEVHKARDLRLGRWVAIKTLRAQSLGQPEIVARFQREARLIARVSHPNICALHDVGEVQGLSYLVLEWIEGQTLAERLDAGALPVEEALARAHEIVCALEAAHGHGVVHRDLKPANVMLTPTGAKLLDFGVAKLATLGQGRPRGDADPTTALAADDPTATGTVMGTLAYMAPEQLEGRPVDGRADLFAFGAMLFEMLTGERAFQGGTRTSVLTAVLLSHPRAASELQPLVPAAVDDVVRRCLAKRPEDRWPSAIAVRQVLDSPGLARRAPDPSAVTREDTQPRRRFRWWPRSPIVIKFSVSITIAALATVVVTPALLRWAGLGDVTLEPPPTPHASPGSRSRTQGDPAALLEQALLDPSTALHLRGYETMVLPADTVLDVALMTEVSTNEATVGDRVEGRLLRDISLGGRLVLPRGTRVRGQVSQSTVGEGPDRRAQLDIAFESVIQADGSLQSFDALRVTTRGPLAANGAVPEPAVLAKNTRLQVTLRSPVSLRVAHSP